MNSTKIPFTVNQKVYIVKTFYKTEAIPKVIECLQKRFNIKLRDTESRVAMQIVLEFESSGSVLKDFFYTKTILGIPGGSTPVRTTVLPDSFWEKGIKEEAAVDTEVDTASIEEDSEQVVEEEDIIHEEYVVIDEGQPVDDLEEIVIETEDYVPAEETPKTTTTTVQMQEKTTEVPVAEKRATEDWKNCVICCKWFPKSKFKIHMSENHLSDDHTCKHCGQNYAQYKYLLHHLKTHAPNKPTEQLICEICGKISASRKTAKAHLLVHSTEKKYECTDCGMRFVRLEGLRRHRRTHTGEKPYRCDHCGATFAAFMSHQMHVRLHTGERPFKCKHCNESFIGAPALNNHLKIHSGEYTFECYSCSGRFKTQKTLEDHIQKKHPGNGEEVIELMIVE